MGAARPHSTFLTVQSDGFGTTPPEAMLMPRNNSEKSLSFSIPCLIMAGVRRFLDMAVACSEAMVMVSERRYSIKPVAKIGALAEIRLVNCRCFMRPAIFDTERVSPARLLLDIRLAPLV